MVDPNPYSSEDAALFDGSLRNFLHFGLSVVINNPAPFYCGFVLIWEGIDDSYESRYRKKNRG